MTDIYRKVFVLFPQGVRTGGPEALVQLVHSLRSIGQDAYLVALPGTEHAEHVEQFRIYDAPLAAQVEDVKDCAVVVPEMALKQLRKYHRAKRFMWWLSIDFSSAFYATKRLESLQGRTLSIRAKRMVLRLLALRDYGRTTLLSRQSDISHLAQSHYARSFLFARCGIVASIVSDFTPTHDFDRLSDISFPRGKRVAYNPAKGSAEIENIRRRLTPDWQFVPIQGMTRKQVVEALCGSAIYLDLGNHPGKDRMPREAALAGAVTIVSRRGAGAFFADTPLPREHKVNTEGDLSVNAVSAVTAALNDLDTASEKQETYRNWIRCEQERFTEEVRRVFIDGWTQDDSLGLQVTTGVDEARSVD